MTDKNPLFFPTESAAYREMAVLCSMGGAQKLLACNHGHGPLQRRLCARGPRSPLCPSELPLA